MARITQRCGGGGNGSERVGAGLLGLAPRASVSISACFAYNSKGWLSGHGPPAAGRAARASTGGCGNANGCSIMRRSSCMGCLCACDCTPPHDGTKHHISSKACGCVAAGHSGGDRGMALHAYHPAAARPRQWRRGGSGVGSEGHRAHRTSMRSRVGVPMVANYSLTFQSYFSAFTQFRVAGGAAARDRRARR